MLRATQPLSSKGLTNGNKAMSGRRDTGIDFIKGMLIFGVVYGHLITALTVGSHCQVWLHTFMRTFDMPFLCSFQDSSSARAYPGMDYRKFF